MKRTATWLAVLALAATIAAPVFSSGETEGAPQKEIVLRYAHMNPPNSPAGMQADYFARRIAEETGGAIKIEVYPSSQLGTIAEMAEQVSMGSIAMHHSTMGGLQPLLEDLGVFDTPYLYRSVDHLLKVTDPTTSPIMKQMNERLIAGRNVRILYAFYFGSRDLTCTTAVYSPKDLTGKKIRAIPSPIYMTAVEGMGAVAIPVDWAEVPTALATGVAQGQENPVSTIRSSKLYEVQDFLMETHHIMGAEPVVINETVFQKLSPAHQKIFLKVAQETRDYGTKIVRDSEVSDVEALKAAGMTVIGVKEGLKLDEFRASVNKVVQDRFGAKWGDFYKRIAAIE